MQFDLTEALVDHILFSMEDQNDDFLVDTQDGVVVNRDEMEDEPEEGPGEARGARYIGLPDWSSSDGFRLMERFAAGLRNPIVREGLSTALDRGRGVFRAYKDVLSTHPEVERVWYAYKEKEMRKAIFAWYNALREEWGLERIGEEPEETAELVLEDFRFRAAEASDTAQSRELHLLCVEEFLMGHGGGDSRDWPEAVQAERKARWRFPAEIAWVAETGQGDFAGYLCAQRDGTAIRIIALDVKAEYRGLGIGEALLLRLLDNLDQTLVSHVLVDLPAFSDGFSRVLLREGFHPYETRYTVDLKKRLPST